MSPTHEENAHLLKAPLTLLCLSLVILLSYLTYFHNFSYPQGFFWDENYHIASAQKYLNGTFFMEQHPPLGKILMALGEYWLDASSNDTQFLNTSYAQGNFKDGFSITGYRFLPVLLGWLTAILLFFIFLLITRSPPLATLLSFLYIFDNALIVHNRGAMLEGPLLFFCALSILLFLITLEYKRRSESTVSVLSLLLGISIGLAFMTKLTGLIMILLLPVLFLQLRPERRKMCKCMLFSALGFFVTFFIIWQAHFSFAKTHNPNLNKAGWYSASEDYKTIVQTGKNTSPIFFPIMLRDSLKFVSIHNRGVPRLDLSKPVENGSPFFFWPFAARSINYRWVNAGEEKYSYLYLQANPVVWLAGLLGIVLASSYVLASFFLPLQRRLPHHSLICTFLGLYAAYMLVMSQLDRVMYLYHYFPALIFSFILFALMIVDMQRIGRWKCGESQRMLMLMILSIGIFASFLFFRPLTYLEPITNEAFQKRSILRIWNLHCVKCEQDDSLVRPPQNRS